MSRKRNKNKHKPLTWWTNELHNLKVKVRNTQNEWKRISSNPNSSQEIISEKHSAYKIKRKEFFRNYV